jgi:hypothetical protein
MPELEKESPLLVRPCCEIKGVVVNSNRLAEKAGKVAASLLNLLVKVARTRQRAWPLLCGSGSIA